jgi:hypothetical protein
MCFFTLTHNITKLESPSTNLVILYIVDADVQKMLKTISMRVSRRNAQEGGNESMPPPPISSIRLHAADADAALEGSQEALGSPLGGHLTRRPFRSATPSRANAMGEPGLEEQDVEAAAKAAEASALMLEPFYSQITGGLVDWRNDADIGVIYFCVCLWVQCVVASG